LDLFFVFFANFTIRTSQSEALLRFALGKTIKYGKTLPQTKVQNPFM